MPACSQLRVGRTTEHGTPLRFVVQIEYWHAGEWLEVARSDHDRDSDVDHNATVSGLHIDLYHPEQGQFAKRTLSGPVSEKEAMGRAERYLRANAETYVRRFETWL